MIHDYYFDGLELYSIRNDHQMQAFIGIKDTYIQMLFVSPIYIGQGLGNVLVNFAVENHGARTVDVNEQNTNARRFYEKMGFMVTGRSEHDAASKPFPVLSMELQTKI